MTIHFNLIWLVDVSTSTYTYEIDEAIFHNVHILSRLFINEIENGDGTCSVQILAFSDNTTHIMHNEISTIRYNMMDKACEFSNFGSALKILKDELGNNLHKFETGKNILFLISDGYFTDQYKPKLKSVNSLLFQFEFSKYAIIINSNVNFESLLVFVDFDATKVVDIENSENVIRDFVSTAYQV